MQGLPFEPRTEGGMGKAGARRAGCFAIVIADVGCADLAE